ncbi:TPR-like protein [Artomyces pyxidatus]|uniref:TPR-like protein n=1 Tax=Artomyces pyxidatus TaxID=48021 RepID=A0ACB8T2E3_9AGAM|nr:TPR-like protein [Artomyces pyxidatus]
MSLQGLMSGADCAVDSNPLSQVLKHTDGDRSLQQDRIAGPSSAKLHQLPTSMQLASEHDMAMARGFFDGPQNQPSAGPAFPLSHYVPRPNMLAQQHQPMGPAHSMNNAPNFSDAWAEIQRRDSGHNFSHPGTPSNSWAGEFHGQRSVPAVPSFQHDMSQSLQQPSQLRGNMSTMYGMSSMASAYPPAFGATSPTLLPEQSKGKGKFQQSDMEAAFAQYASSFQRIQTQSQPQESTDGVSQLTEDLSATTLTDPSAADEQMEGTEFKHVWEQLQNSDLPPPPQDMAKWEAEFNQLMNSQREESDHDYGGAMQQAWDGGIGDLSDTFGDSMKFDHEGIPLLEPYKFEPKNPFMDPSSSQKGSLLDQAKMLLEQNGSLSEAALMLEASIQQGVLGEGGYEAWILLGETRNMDEREEAGMKALTEGVRLAEQAGAVGVGMLSLAISYTNESYDRASHTMLLRWLRARFPEEPISHETLQSLSQTPWHSHTLVTDAFLSVARAQHAQGIVDPDVQIALGVLSYTNGTYDRAKDCFETALSVRPRDYLLWNRLGSSLSNGNKPEESLGAYREALNLRPTYTRAIYNVGVACLNIGAHKEAAEHFLSALALQESTGGDKSEQLWLTLGRAFVAMERKDLAELTKTGQTNLEAFRAEGFDF